MLGVRLGLLLGIVAALPAWGCTGGCARHVDVRSNFTVEIRFEGRPLAGVRIEIHAEALASRGASGPTWTFTTGADGRAVVQVSEGEYWFDARKAGMSVASECSLRVSKSTGKRELKYTFHEIPSSVAKMTGRLTEWQWESRLHEMVRSGKRTEVLSVGRVIELRGFDGQERSVIVGVDGTFDFGEIPDGVYVLQMRDSGFYPRLLRLDVKASRRNSDLMVEGALCGGKQLLFRDEVKE